jgi:hypothetical protein
MGLAWWPAVVATKVDRTSILDQDPVIGMLCLLYRFRSVATKYIKFGTMEV